MNILALLIALFCIGAIGLVGVATPTGLASAVRPLLAPVGFVVIALLRVSFGVVLVLAARVSRAPTRALRVLGSIMIVAGLLTPLFGVEQRAMLDWWTAQVPDAHASVGGAGRRDRGFRRLRSSPATGVTATGRSRAPAASRSRAGRPVP